MMKKLIVFIGAFVLLSGSAFAVDDSDYKDHFYSGFLNGFFGGIQEKLISEGADKGKVNQYVSALRGRVKRSELERKTWGCLSKNNYAAFKAETSDMAQSCIAPWVDDFLDKNEDLLKLLY